MPERLFWKNQLINLEKIRKEIINYYNANYSLNIDKIIYKKQNPKISLIITLFNQEKYILKIYSCIQNQSLEDIEIILVDDNSQDSSFFLIQKIMEKDKRIVYLKNSVNKGQFYSRNKGVIKSKGEYVLIIDPDDLLLNDILIKSYETAKYYKLDIIFRVANSYGLLEQIGYFWNRNISNSTTFKSLKPENANENFRSLFSIMY